MIPLRFALLTATLGIAASACSHNSAAGNAKTSAPAAREKTVTLLHIADTHAQLETHPEYMPGEDPSIAMMGGYARLRTALDRERASATGAVFVADGAIAPTREERALAHDLPTTVFSQDALLQQTAAEGKNR